MTLDVPSTLVIVGVGGFTSFRSFVFFSNSSYNSYNGEKLVLRCLQLGAISSSIFLFGLSLFDVSLRRINYNTDYLSYTILSYLALCVLQGVVWASLSKKYKKDKCFQRLIEGYKLNDTPDFSNELERNLISLLVPRDFGEKEDSNSKEKQLDKTNVSFFELTDHQIYVGYLKYCDLNDDMPIAERFVTIIPLYSGRRGANGKVVLTTNYEEVAGQRLMLKEVIKDPNFQINNESEFFEKTILTIHPITFSQSLIKSLRKFDAELAQNFTIFDQN